MKGAMIRAMKVRIDVEGTKLSATIDDGENMKIELMEEGDAAES